MTGQQSETVVLSISAADEDAMVALGAQLAAVREPGMVVYLNGELGMGKTTFSRGFIQSLGHAGAVKSPTYTLVEPYELEGRELESQDVEGQTIYHFDLYRLGDPEELEFMGIRDYFDGENICLVEWPERGEGVLPPADLVINIGREGSGRLLQFYAATVLGERVAEQLALDRGDVLKKES
jgi:tRNA threonylcarbamoyladenosine biosynthesis protein TsaE